MEYTYLVPPAFEGKKLLAFLRGGAGLSASLVRSVKYLDDGLTVNGARAKTDAVLKAGDAVVVRLREAPVQLAPCGALVPVAYESAAAVVFDKPAGMATHPTLGYPDGTLANVWARMLLERGERGTFRPVNRLDKNTSGLVLTAKDRLAASALAKSARKVYLALVSGTVADDAGEINAPIARRGDSIIGRCVRGDGAPSVTRYAVLRRYGGYTLLRVETLTGRTHQIRVHMQYIGHPLLGDTLYGEASPLIGRHALHCARMCFDEPYTGERAAVESPLPDDMRRLAGEEYIAAPPDFPST